MADGCERSFFDTRCPDLRDTRLDGESGIADRAALLRLSSVLKRNWISLERGFLLRARFNPGPSEQLSSFSFRKLA